MHFTSKQTKNFSFFSFSHFSTRIRQKGHGVVLSSFATLNHFLLEVAPA
jgi:hypothetical protein